MEGGIIDRNRWDHLRIERGPGGGRLRFAPIALDAGSNPGFRSHDTLPLRGHQDEALREDRVPRRPPGRTSERLPRADDPPLDVLRRLTEWGR